MKPSLVTDRIQVLDQLRAVAALGVLWIHCWTYSGNPRLKLLNFDVTNILALGGNGVDLFFVISGFCMYYFYSKINGFSYDDFWKFIRKRWKRLSPAFYTASLVYGIYWFESGMSFSFLKDALITMLYLNSILPQYSTSSHFWTLSVEWQFYLILPFILIYQDRIGFKNIFLTIFLVFAVISSMCIIFLKDQADSLSYQIIFRYFEFMCGIMVARLVNNKSLVLTNKVIWLIFFILVSYSGRFLISKPSLTYSYHYHNFVRLAGFLIMSIGFGGIVYLSVQSERWVHSSLVNRLLNTIGRVSYSFYLWHLIVCMLMVRLINAELPNVSNIMAAVINFIASSLLLFPLSILSYNFLEKPFMASSKSA